MAEKTKADEQERILDLYEEKESLKKVADDTEVSVPTVRRYVKEAWLEGDERVRAYEPQNPDPGEEFGAGEVDPDEVSESVFDNPADDVADELEDFFEKVCDNTQLRYDAIKFLIIDDVRDLGDIPDGSQLFREILAGKTGVSNEDVTQKIVSKYLRFVQGNDEVRRHLNQSNVTMGGQAWSNASMGQGGGFTRWGQGSDQGQGGARGGGPGQHPGRPQGVGGQRQQNPPTREEVAEIAAEAASRAVKEAQGSGQQSPNSMAEKLGEELLQAQITQLVEQFESGGGEMSEEDLIQLVDQMVERRVGGDRDRGRGGKWGGFPDSGSPAAQVAWLVEHTEMSHEDAKEFVEQNEDPEILEWKFKKEKFDRRTELYQDTVNDVLGTVERITGDWDKKIAGSLYDQITSEAGAEQDRQPQERRRPQEPMEQQQSMEQAADFDVGECPECDGQMRVQGDQKHCINPDCGYGEDVCDICQEPLELPAVGQTDFFFCGGDECREVLEAPREEGGVVECELCGWEGTREESPHEFTQCSSCESLRPIARDMEEMQEIQRDNVAVIGINT